MTYRFPMLPPRADATHARSRRQPPRLRPRFRNPLPVAPDAVWPPFVGAEPYTVHEAADQAAQDGHPLALLIWLRAEAAAEIERLIAFLDATEGDPDADGGDDEPTMAQIRTAAALGEPTVDDEEGGDLEPTLGWSRGGAVGDSFDLEDVR